MRKTINFNKNWYFAPSKLPIGSIDENFVEICLPHTNKLFSYNNVNNRDYQFVSTYKKSFNYHPGQREEQVFLDFDGVMIACEIYLNGEFLKEHKGGFTPFSVNLTSALQVGKNELMVYVDSREREDIPPFGSLVDYLTFGGIYRDVTLRVVHPVHFENLFIHTSKILKDPEAVCEFDISQQSSNLTLQAQLLDNNQNILATVEEKIIGDHDKIVFESLNGIELWSLDNPYLYTVKAFLIQDDEVIDSMSTRFGFRTAEFRSEGGFYLNGERISLFGLNRHQTYPYIGAAAPARLQHRDAEILKYELGCNIVRSSHYPQSPHFLDRCDEIGLLVFEEIPGWHHIGDAKWQQISMNELESMILRDRNHPSVILWGVRINESPDNDKFYEQTNTLAHRLDPTRQTGGVRDFLQSSFLEDVFTFNDFLGEFKDPIHKPHLITEFAGHMYPTKIWDPEDRKINHALLHAKRHNQQMGNPNIAGAIGWCAFDYNTHKEFGSGDRICYHGVMDIFRQPKWAAYFYQSQKSPVEQTILNAATQWTMGDRAGGGNDPLIVFSNCDQVEVVLGDHTLGKFKPDYDNYPYLKHPPFTITGVDIYSAWEAEEYYDLHLIGYIDEKPVIDQWISGDSLPVNLELSINTDQLHANGCDMTWLEVRITDKFGNPLPYVNKIINFEVHGPAELIGENPLPLFGGQAALLIKSGQQEGAVVIRASTSGLPPAQVTLAVKELNSHPPSSNFSN